MDFTPFLEITPAPLALFNRLDARATRVRYMVPTADGDYRSVTWAAHAKQVKHCALFLRALGVQAGDRGAVFAPNSVEWMAAALGLQAASAVMVPVYPANTPDQAAYVVKHSDAKVVFVDTPALLSRIFERWSDYENVLRIVTLSAQPLEAGPLLEQMRAKGLSCPPIADVEKKLLPWSKVMSIGAAREAEAPGAFDELLKAITLDQPAEMLYTSGTSGNPKGVPLTHRNVGSNASDWVRNNAPLLSANDVDVLWLPMSHIFGFGEACLGNLLGFTTYLADPKEALAVVPKVKPTVFMSVPALWEKLAAPAQAAEGLEAKKAALAKMTGGQLRFCLSGGAGLKREVKETFHQCGLLIIEGYGLTETSPTLTLNRPDAFRFDTVGKPIPSVTLKLADDGEILTKGPNVFSGYHKDPAATREAFTDDGWFKTGDVGRFTDDGFLQIVDRKKDILVTAGGKNVPPANIEIRFQDDPLISHLVVYGDGERFLVAGVWLTQPAVDDAPTRAKVQQRIDAVNAKLASYETIKKFAIIAEPLSVDGGTLTSTLKVRRKQVYARHGEALKALYA